MRAWNWLKQKKKKKERIRPATPTQSDTTRQVTQNILFSDTLSDQDQTNEERSAPSSPSHRSSYSDDFSSGSGSSSSSDSGGSWD